MVRFTGLLVLLASGTSPLSPGRSDFKYTNFSDGRGFAFYLHKLFGWPGFCILFAHTFRVAGVLHFTYTHFSGVRGFAFYLHTLSGRFWSKIEKNDFKFEKFSALRAPFFLSNPWENEVYIEKFPRCARGLYHLMEKWGDDLVKNADFHIRKLSLVCYFFYLKISALRARPLSSHRNMGETIWRKLAMFK